MFDTPFPVLFSTPSLLVCVAVCFSLFHISVLCLNGKCMMLKVVCILDGNCICFLCVFSTWKKSEGVLVRNCYFYLVLFYWNQIKNRCIGFIAAGFKRAIQTTIIISAWMGRGEKKRGGNSQTPSRVLFLKICFRNRNLIRSVLWVNSPSWHLCSGGFDSPLDYNCRIRGLGIISALQKQGLLCIGEFQWSFR